MIRRSPILLCAILMLAALPVTAGAQRQVEVGEFVIETDSALGLPRVGLVDNGRTIPLWSPHSLDSSSVYLRIGNTVELLSADSPGVRAEVIADESAFAMRWSVRDIEVDLTVAAREHVAPGALVMLMRISNRGDRSRSVGIRYLIDTWLGESEHAHFATAHGEAVAAERTFASSDESVISSGSNGVLRLHLERGTAASAVAVANRRRLTDAGWAYSTGRERGFSLPPFSVQDSALHIVYDRENLPPGDTRTIETWFTAGTEELPVAFVDRDPEEPVDERDPSPARDPETPAAPGAPAPAVPVDPEEPAPDVTEPDVPATDATDRGKIVREVQEKLKRLREISEDVRRAEPGELEELREAIERLRRERDRL